MTASGGRAIDRPTVRRRLKYAFRVSLFFVAAIALLIVLRPTDLSWWLVRLPGLVALLAAAAAIVIQPSPRSGRWHHWLGWSAGAATLLHILLVAGLHPKFWDWLAASVPLEIVFGILAALAQALTFFVQRPRFLRQRIGLTPALQLHRPAGFAVVLAAAAHVALIAGTPTWIVVLACLAGTALFVGILANRREAAIVAVIALSVACAVFVAIAPMAEARLAGLRRSPIDSAGFLHASHSKVTCVTCHHNFLDDTGKENCLNCHKRVSLSEPMRIDRMFHAFCGECHRDERTAGHKTGPIDDCSGCHAGWSMFAPAPAGKTAVDGLPRATSFD